MARIKLRVCDICGGDMEHCMFRAKYKLKILKKDRHYDRWNKLDVCDKCMDKIIDYVRKGG